MAAPAYATAQTPSSAPGHDAATPAAGIVLASLTPQSGAELPLGRNEPDAFEMEARHMTAQIRACITKLTDLYQVSVVKIVSPNSKSEFRVNPYAFHYNNGDFTHSYGLTADNENLTSVENVTGEIEQQLMSPAVSGHGLNMSIEQGFIRDYQSMHDMCNRHVQKKNASARCTPCSN